MTRNKGFSIVEVVIVLALLGIIGLLGWRVWSANQTTDDSGRPPTTQTDNAPTVNSDKDLDKASDQLDATNIEGSESDQLDTETNF